MAPKNKINLKDRLEDGELDLSMSELQEVPVKEIAALKKATSLDLSNNRLKSLPPNFTTLTHIVKLDLSNNQLTELPEDFGALRQLKHLDLYNNQLTHLPLSFSELRALRWLDVKNNPLVPAVARVAGPCLDAVQCQKSARELVEFFQRTQQQIEDEKQRLEQQRLIELEAQEVLERQQEKKREKKRAARARRVGQKVATRSESTSSETVTAPAPVVPQPTTQNERRYKRADSKRKSSRRSSFKSYFLSLFLGLILLFLLSAWPSGLGVRIAEVTAGAWNRSKEILPESIQPYANILGANIADIHEETSKLLQGPVKDAMYAIADIANIVFVESRNIITNTIELICHLVHELRKKII